MAGIEPVASHVCKERRGTCRRKAGYRWIEDTKCLAYPAPSSQARSVGDRLSEFVSRFYIDTAKAATPIGQSADGPGRGALAQSQTGLNSRSMRQHINELPCRRPWRQVLTASLCPSRSSLARNDRLCRRACLPGQSEISRPFCAMLI